MVSCRGNFLCGVVQRDRVVVGVRSGSFRKGARALCRERAVPWLCVTNKPLGGATQC